MRRWASLFALLLVAHSEAASYGEVLELEGKGPLAMSGTTLVARRRDNFFALFEQTASSWVLRQRLQINASATESAAVDVAGSLTVVAQGSQVLFFRFNHTAPGDGEVTDLEPVFVLSGFMCLSVQIVGNSSVVRCGDCVDALDCSRVVVFEEQSPGVWQQTDSIAAHYPRSQAFGAQIAGSDTVLVISDPYYNGGTDIGGVFFYERGTNASWQLVAQFAGLKGGAELGCSVAVSPDESAVLAGSHAMAAHLFRRNASGLWAERARVVQEGTADGGFGQNGRFLQNGELLVLQGASFVYVYDAVTLQQLQKLPAQTGAVTGRFGLAAVQDNVTFVAASLYGPAVSVFGLVPPPVPAVVIACTVVVLAALVAIAVGFFVVRCVRRRKRGAYSQL